MDLEQAHHKASVVRLNRGWCAEGHLVDVTKRVPRNRFPGQGK